MKNRKKGISIIYISIISILRIYQYWIFNHTVIKTCFEILKSSEHEKLWRYLNYKSPNFQDCSEAISADPPISFYYMKSTYLTHWDFTKANYIYIFYNFLFDYFLTQFIPWLGLDTGKPKIEYTILEIISNKRI